MFNRNSLYSAAAFALTISPVAILFGWAMSGIHRANSPIMVAAGYMLDLIIPATFAHLIITSALTRASSSRKCGFSACCGLLFMAFIFTGLVQNSIYVIRLFTRHKHDPAMLAISAFVWSLLATGIVMGGGRLISRLSQGKRLPNQSL